MLDLLATNVVIVTTLLDGRPHGSTSNAWGEPEAGDQVLVTLSAAGRTCGAVREAGWFGVSVLAADQADVARAFARHRDAPADRFAGVELDGGGAVPVLADCLATMICRLRAGHERDFGSYTVLFGEVVDQARRRAGAPLVFHDRTFGAVAPLTDSQERRR